MIHREWVGLAKPPSPLGPRPEIQPSFAAGRVALLRTLELTAEINDWMWIDKYTPYIRFGHLRADRLVPP